jgi:DNA-binding response OmpR family regulator
MKILLVEDSQRLRMATADGLRRSGHAVDAVADGRDGLIHARTSAYDVIVLDLMLPVMDGLTVLRTLREKHVMTHVLILSARDRVEQRVEGLRAGADDYLIKPFAFDELLARIESLGRRAHGRKTSLIELGAVTLDLTAQRVTVNDAVVELTGREYAVLEYLALEAGRPATRAGIEEHIYDSAHAVWSNAVDSIVSALRRKLAAHGVHGLIQTRRGIGYEVSAAPSSADRSR